MSKFDQAKNLFNKAQKVAVDGVEKAKQTAKENPDKIRGGIDKVAGAADKVTKGKYADKISKASDKVEETVQKGAHSKPLTDAGHAGTPSSAADEAGRKVGEVRDPIASPDPIDRPGPID
ncbi:antitoxin [Calidifontibacter terrae]